MKQKTKSLDEIFEDLDLRAEDQETRLERKCLAVWIPDDYKIKFDDLQKKTKQKFGKKIRELVMLSIDKVYPDAI